MFRVILLSVLTAISLCGLTSGELFAADTQCLQATYADALQTNAGNGRVEFGYNAGVSNNPDNILNTPEVSQNNGSTVLTCEIEPCIASGQPVAPLALPNFKTSNSKIKLTVPWNAQETFGADGTREYKKITLSSQATLTVDETNHHDEDEYIIDSLSVGHKGTLNLRAGTYWIKKFSLGSEATLNVIGEGTVRIISQQPFSIGWRAQLNVVTGAVLDNASKLLIVNEHKMQFASESTVNAILYSQDKIDFGYSAHFMGAAVGQRITLGAEAHAVYQAPQGGADFSPICPGDALEPPTVSITSPGDGDFINDNLPTIEITYSSEGTIDTESVDITLNNNLLDANCTVNQTDAQCVPTSALPDAQVSIGVTVADTESNVSDKDQISFTIDTVLPEIIITAPSNSSITNVAQVDVTGTVSEPVPTLTLNANGNLRSIQADQNNAFNESVDLAEGNNQITVTAADTASNQGSASVSVTLDTQVPSIPNIEFITISNPENGEVIVTGLDNSVEPNSQVTITNTRTGQSIVVTTSANGTFIASIAAEVGDVIQVDVTDSAGNMGGRVDLPPITDTRLPPDPAMVAPALDPTQVTPFIDAVTFLFSGSNPIQTGVVPDAIDSARVAVIRGKVLDRDNNPLSGVTVSVLNRSEFGQTLTRTDGMFDLAVNGGSVVTINYQLENYLPVQRKISVPWQDYVFVDHIVMVSLDPQVTTIDLTSTQTFQVAQGTSQIDADGNRQATILFPQGTTATMMLQNGTTQALTTLNVRATEYTWVTMGLKQCLQVCLQTVAIHMRLN